MQFMEPVDSNQTLNTQFWQLLQNIPSEMIKHNVVLMLVFPTLHKLHTSNNSNKLTNQMQQFYKFII